MVFKMCFGCGGCCCYWKVMEKGAKKRNPFSKIWMMWLFTYLLLFESSVAKIRTYESFDEGEQRLLKHLKNFNVNSRPVNISSHAVHVNVTMDIVRLDAVDEKGQSVRMKLHVNYEWRNPFLVWDPEQYGDVFEVILPQEEIWTPPIQLFNEASKAYGEIYESMNGRTVVLTNQGYCSLTYAQFFKSTCEIDVGDFPFDQQICDLTFGSWSMDKRLLELRASKNNAIDLELYKENGEWELTWGILKSESVKYPIHRQYHNTINLQILIRRKYLFFIMNLVLPCALIACMIFLVFVLPAKSGERISLGITVMLSMAIFQELSSEKLPSSSDNYPLLAFYYTSSMFEIGIAMVANCLILNVFYRDYDMPAWTRRLLFDKMARFVRVDVPVNRTQHFLDKITKEASYELDTINESTIVNGNTYGTEDEMVNGSGNFFPSRKLSRESQGIGNNRKKKFSNTNTPTDLNYNNNTSNPQLIATRQSSVTTELTARIDEKKILAEDWKMAARIMDRIMLIVAIFVGVLSFIIIFSHAARFREMFIV